MLDPANLLATKWFTPPPTPTLVDRFRLIERLNASVRGHLSELGAAEMHFTSEEALTFLTDVMAFSLTAEQVEDLERRTEGWIAGLHLAAL